jgi:hypothetical protein
LEKRSFYCAFSFARSRKMFSISILSGSEYFVGQRMTAECGGAARCAKPGKDIRLNALTVFALTQLRRRGSWPGFADFKSGQPECLVPLCLRHARRDPYIRQKSRIQPAQGAAGVAAFFPCQHRLCQGEHDSGQRGQAALRGQGVKSHGDLIL